MISVSGMNKRVWDIIRSHVEISDPHWIRSKKQIDKATDMEYSVYTNDDIKLVIAHCIYNDEDFIEKVLEDDLQMPDIDMIHVIDGAWEHGGKSVNSTDRTKEIVEDFAKRSPIPVVFVENKTGKLWKSESEKRNHQLDLIEKEFPNDKCYVFVKDGDEIIKNNNGRRLVWTKAVLAEAYPEVGLVRAYADGSKREGKTPRFIPTGQGIHYYTGKSMCIHNKSHNVLVDYNELGEPTVNLLDIKVFYLDEIFIVNYWVMRNKERIKEKHIFDVFRDEQDKTFESQNIPCEY